MKQGFGLGMSFVLLGTLLLGLGVGNTAAVAQEAKVPRVALIGDSWGMFWWGFRTFKEVLPEYEGLENYIEVGASTVVGGAKAYEFLSESRLQSVTDLLTENATVDVVIISLGGNDFLGGDQGVLAEDPGRKVRWRCPCTDGCTTEVDGMHPAEWNDLLLAKVKDDIGTLVTHILAIRPDIRVLLSGYTFVGRVQHDECELESQQRGFVAMELAKQELATANDRVFFVNNFGLMQWNFGVYYDQDPEDTSFTTPPDIAPQDPSITYPEVALTANNPGGFPEYLAPYQSLIDNDIHLTEEGYALVARRLMDVYIEEWLNYPKAIEVKQNSTTGTEAVFGVRFTEAVSGVSVDDFAISLTTKSGVKAATVTSVTPAAGPAAVYQVTVDTGGWGGTVSLEVLDDDSIQDAGGTPLGGVGTGNGAFTFNGVLDFAELPVPEDADFEGALRFLAQTTGPYEGMIGGFSFAPELFDANGDFLAEGSLDDPIVIPGNGLLESYEFALISACMDNPALDFSASGGLSAAAVRDAWQNNIAQMQADLGGEEDLAATLLPGLDSVLAGYATLGDSNSNILLITLMVALSSEDLKEQFPINVVTPNLANYVSFPNGLGQYGDADQDGFSNDAEYAYFMPDGASGYASAALNPNQKPVTPAGFYEVGQSLRMAVLTPVKWDSTFQWFHNGTALSDDGVVVGSATRTLQILSLSEAHSGTYTCQYTNKDKAAAEYGPVSITVGAEVPLAGTGTLLLLSVGTALIGGMACRRKRA